VRPGPIQGDMVHPYLQRRSGKELVEFPHKSLKRALAKTLGVPIFQEQVMKLAILVADYTPGEADKLRRDMAAWRSSGRIEQHRERLISRMIANGIPLEFAERVFSQIRGFGEYGFPESHAASFALIAYITAWLRCHHIAAFTAALLNAQPMGFYSPATIVEDAKRHGVEVRPIDVQTSAWDCTLERKSDGELAVRMGLRYVKGFGVREQQALVNATGPWPDLATFVRSTGLSRKALHTLAEAGGFEGLGIERRDAIWQLRGVLATMDDRITLPPESAPDDEQPSFVPVGAGESILWDYRTSMHSTRGHPLICIRSELERRGLPLAEQVVRMRDGRSVDYVGLVICRQRPGTASGVTFYTLEDETGFVNVVVWQRVFEQYPLLAKSALLLGVSGRLQVAEGVVHVVAERLWDPDLRLRTEGTSVRHFH
jgi:error-prone DNA polymerase